MLCDKEEWKYTNATYQWNSSGNCVSPATEAKNVVQANCVNKNPVPVPQGYVDAPSCDGYSCGSWKWTLKIAVTTPYTNPETYYAKLLV